MGADSPEPIGGKFMAKTNSTKTWCEFTENEKRSAIWDVMSNPKINFKKQIDEETVVEIIKATKDLDFADKADSIRIRVYDLCLSIVNDERILGIVKKTLRIEE